ncbi:MAG: putative transporter [Candidatus Aminicenantes bacterium]|nr:putative transporter [Candidatus Aminicenantes bacterium]
MKEERAPAAGTPAGVRTLIYSAWAGIFVFGIVMAILGAILPSLFERIRFNKSEAGNLFFVMNLAMLGMSVVFGPVVDRFGYRILLAFSALLVAGAFLLFTVAPSYSILLAAALLLGLGGGGLNGGSNALTSDLNPERRSAALNLLGIFFGFGALLIPFLIGTLLGFLGINVILIIAATLSLIPFVIFLLLRFPQAKQAQGFPLRRAARVVRSPLLWLCGFLLFFQSGNEFTVGGWISTYLNENFRFSPMSAALILAAYWGGMMVGRLVVSRVLVRTMRNEALILSSAVLALAGTIIMAAAPSGLLASVGVVMTGLGFAAIFPTTLAVAGEAFADLTGTAFSVIFMVALAGGMTAPWLAGRVANSSGLRSGFIIPVVGCAMIILIELAIIQLAGRKKPVA